MKVLIVRASDDARRTAARLEAAGHAVIVAPVLQMHTLDFAPPQGRIDAVVATSAHAFGRPDQLVSMRGAPLFVVGSRTAEAAFEAGFGAPKIVAADAGRLAVEIAQTVPTGARIAYLAGRDRKPELETSLGGTYPITVVETYVADAANRLPQAASDALGAGEIDVALHYSKRSAEILLDLARRAGLAAKLGALPHVAISADAAKPLLAAGLRVAVAAQPTENSLIEEFARIEAAEDRARDAGASDA